MLVLEPRSLQVIPAVQDAAQRVLGTQLLLDLEKFPELDWLPSYLATLHALDQERDRLTQQIQSITDSGDVYRDCWIEPYVKFKNGKQYSYHQLRWLTGERKPSGQPKVKTKHLSHSAVGRVRAAIERGHQIERLEQERQAIEEEIRRLKQMVLGTRRRLQRVSSQNFFGKQGRVPL